MSLLQTANISRSSSRLRSAISLRSCPAENARPAPLSTIARTAGPAAWRSRSASRRGASNSGLEFLERAGYVVRGLLYTVMGVLALGVALGVGGMATDQSGSLVVITSGPFGRMLLAGVVIGLGAYSVWGFVPAIFDPLHRGADPPGIAERLGFAWSGIAYTAMVLLALQLLLGSSHSPSPA